MFDSTLVENIFYLYKENFNSLINTNLIISWLVVLTIFMNIRLVDTVVDWLVVNFVGQTKWFLNPGRLMITILLLNIIWEDDTKM